MRDGGARLTPSADLGMADPLHAARVVRAGNDLTVVAYGPMVKTALEAAAAAQDDGHDLEVIDLRSLSPFDWNAIAASVRRTSKALVVYEDPISWGFGAEVAAWIAAELFEYLDGPVRRVAAKDCQVGYAPSLEDGILPQIEDIASGMRELARY